MRGIIPTTEQFAEQIWTRIASLLQQIAPQVILEEIVLHETPNNRVRKQRS
jgi:6-pyruvoyl-tetrahydropterin synthase